jgi:hypothetical protein
MEQKTITAQEKWTSGGTNQIIRIDMLKATAQSTSYANLSWKKLPYIVKSNLQNRTWTS